MEKHKQGDIVIHILTGEVIMILDVLQNSGTGYKNAYQIRRPNYEVVKVADFEVKDRE